MKRKIIKLCECGCGRLVKKTKRFISTHHFRSNNPAIVGRSLSEETKRKISLSNKGRIISERNKKIASETHKGKILSEETKEKIRIKNKGKRLKEETKRKISLNRKGKSLSENTRGKMSLFHKGKSLPDWVKEKMSVAQKELWKDPVYARKQMKASHIKPNKLEIQFENILRKIFCDVYKYVGDGEFIIAGKCPDFININGKKKIIELYGSYWHRDDDPQDRINLFRQYGYDTLIVWDYELKKGREKELERKLELFHDRNTL